MILKFSLKFVSLLLVLIWTITANASTTLQCEVTSYQQALNSGYTLKWAKSWVPENFNAEIDETGIIRVGEYRQSLISNNFKGDKIEFSINVPDRDDGAIIKGTYFKKKKKFAVKVDYDVRYSDSGLIWGVCKELNINKTVSNSSGSPSEVASLTSQSSIDLTNKFIRWSDFSLCHRATKDGQWSASNKNKDIVQEAKRRGLTCGINDIITTQVASFSLDYYTDLQICEASTTKNKQMIKIWNNALNFVQEAKRRGLNCDVSESSSTLVASSTNISNQIPLITNIRAQTYDKQGIVTGSVNDNASIAEVTVDGNVVTVSSNGSFEYTTYVPATGLSIEVQVTDLAGLSSSQTVTLKRNVNLSSASISFDRLNPIAKPVKRNNNALALIIGVSDYENTPAKAIFADSDAMVFRDYASEKLGIPDNRIKTLVNDGADEREMLLAIQTWLTRSVKQDQTDVYVFFAGHGLASDDGEQMYLLPYDGSPELLDDTAILRDRLFNDISNSNPRSVTVFLDTCYSGSNRGSEMLIADARPILLKAKDTSVPESFTVFTAAAGDETAKSLEEAKHGLFSYFLMKGMEGDADTNGDKQITAGELHAYVKSNVVQQSSGTQTPELQGDADRVLVRFQ